MKNTYQELEFDFVPFKFQQGIDVVKRLDRLSFFNMSIKSRSEETKYCVDDCSKCDNTDCMYNRKRETH